MKVPISQDPDLAGVEFEQQFNFKCKYCLRNLSSRQNLREHMYIHTGEKPYICDIVGCNQSFRQGSLLSIHKKIHSEITKGLKKGKKPEKKCLYPKLTQLIDITENDVHYPLCELEKNEWLIKIGKETYMETAQHILSTIPKNH